ncbi:minor tail protein [Streptomyces phage Mischief19]|nr:minor tail protein [Streptomyces phage Mischief19]
MLTLTAYNNAVAAAEAQAAADLAVARAAELADSKLTGTAPVFLVASSTVSAAVKRAASYVGTGIADQTKIQAAVDAAFAAGGGTVQLTGGTFFNSAPVTLHPTVKIIGAHGEQIYNPGQFTGPSVIKPVAGFTGGAVFVLLDQTNGGYVSKSAEQQIMSLTIDGTGVVGVPVHGIQGGGYIHGVLLRDVAIRGMSGKGIYTFFENGAQPFSWTFEHVVVDNSEGDGIHLINHSDATLIDVVSIGAGGNAFIFSNMPNSRALGCRAEWSEGTGYYITGNFGNGQGSGGMSLVGCSSDRNRFDGMLVNATGTAPLLVQGCTFRRDGRNGNAGGGDYSGFRATGAGMPIIIDGLSVSPGVDDTGAGVNSPVNAFKVSGSTYVALGSGFLHGATAGFVDGGGNGMLRRGPNIGERTGTTNAPVDVFGGAWKAYGYTELDGGQSNGKWNIWSGGPDALNIGSLGGGIAIKEGVNGRMGVATLAAGTVTVANTSVTANTRIFLTGQGNGASGTPGTPRVSARTPGVGFTITSSSASDTSPVAWELKEPAA